MHVRVFAKLNFFVKIEMNVHVFTILNLFNKENAC